MRSTVGRADRRIAEDVPDPAAVCVTVPSFCDTRFGVAAVEESAVLHSGPREDVLAHIVPVAHPACTLDSETGEDVADIAVAALDSRARERRLVDELRQEVRGLDDGIAGLVHPERRVVFTGLLIGVVSDTARVRQQVEQRDVGADGRAGEIDVIVDRRLEVQRTELDLLQNGDAREEFGDGCGVEAQVEGVRDAPPRRRKPPRGFEDHGTALTHEHDSREFFVERGFEIGGVHVLIVVTGRRGLSPMLCRLRGRRRSSRCGAGGCRRPSHRRSP